MIRLRFRGECPQSKHGEVLDTRHDPLEGVFPERFRAIFMPDEVGVDPVAEFLKDGCPSVGVVGEVLGNRERRCRRSSEVEAPARVSRGDCLGGEVVDSGEDD